AGADRGTSLRLGRGTREQCGRGAHPRASQEARGAVHPHRSRGGLPGEARAVTSLRARLLAWLMAGVVFVGAAGGWVVYRNALVEADAFFDYHLRQTALILRDEPVEYLLAPQIPRADAPYDFVVQVWSLDGVRTSQSRSSPCSGSPRWSRRAASTPSSRSPTPRSPTRCARSPPR